MAEKNARLYLAEKIPLDPGRDVEDLQQALCLPRPPAIIEAFDVSTLGGSFAVAGMVRFVNGTADKAGYRRYRIRTVEGQNDFGMLVEAATRRLARLEAEQKPPPDLLLIDGGKGQLNAVAAALSAVANPPMLASLAKEEEVLHSAYLPEPVRLDRTHPALKLAQRVRDEVHRWSVSYHRAIRGRQFRHSSIESVHGIGPKTALRLLKAFGSFQALKAASAEDIAKVKGVSAETALRLRDFLDRS